MRVIAAAAALLAALPAPPPPAAAAAGCVPDGARVIRRAPGLVVFARAGERWACADGRRRRVLELKTAGAERFALTWRRGRVVELVDAGPRGVRRLDRGRASIPHRLRRDLFGAVTWRREGTARGAVIGVRGCGGGRRRILARDARVIVFERTVSGEDEGDFDGRVFACDRARGVQRLLTTTIQSFDYGEFAQRAIVRWPYVALVGGSESGRAGFSSAWVTVNRVTTGALTATGGIGDFDPEIVRVLISRTGALAYSWSQRQWTGTEAYFVRVRGVSTVRRRRETVLDESPGVDAGTLRLRGARLTWRRDGRRRSASLP